MELPHKLLSQEYPHLELHCDWDIPPFNVESIKFEIDFLLSFNAVRFLFFMI